MNQISGLVAVAAITLAACSSTGTTAVQPTTPAGPAQTTAQHALAHGAEAPINAVPWSEVGPGWMLAMWSAAAPTKGGAEPAGEPQPATLYLLNPDGGRYAVTTFPAPPGGSSRYLVDWSGDGSRALFSQFGARELTVIEVDLHTGAQSTFTVKGEFYPTPGYTRPDGKAILLSKGKTPSRPLSLERVDLAGNHQLTYPVDQLGSKFDPVYLSTPDGTQLVLGNESGGLAIMGNDGKGINKLPVPGQGLCTPTRWWDKESTVVVANCHDADFHESRLWLVSTDGATATPLTEPSSGGEGEGPGAETAWLLPQGTYVQALGGCSYRFLAKRDDVTGTLTKVSVPNVDDHKSVGVLGDYHGHLQLEASLPCGDGKDDAGSQGALIDYDPAANTSKVLLGPTVNGGDVINAIAYPTFD